jgi:predicted nucleic acid-binding protein
MEAFDTNVIVRLLVEDDPEQSAAALRCWRAALADGGAFLSKVGLAETVWVLSRAYRFERAAIVDAVGALLRSRGLVVEFGVHPQPLRHDVDQRDLGRAAAEQLGGGEEVGEAEVVQRDLFGQGGAGSVHAGSWRPRWR